MEMHTAPSCLGRLWCFFAWPSSLTKPCDLPTNMLKHANACTERVRGLVGMRVGTPYVGDFATCVVPDSVEAAIALRDVAGILRMQSSTRSQAKVRPSVWLCVAVCAYAPIDKRHMNVGNLVEKPRDPNAVPW